MSSFYINDPEWASELQRNLDDYMMRLYDGLESGEDVETVSGQPFCECSDCHWREVLAFVAPIIMQGQLDGKIELA